MELPAFLTVTEAAAFLRIGRTAAYELATRFEATAGAEGLPVVRIGRQLRVPRARLELLAAGPLNLGPTVTPPSPTPTTSTPDDADQVQLAFPSNAA